MKKIKNGEQLENDELRTKNLYMPLLTISAKD
jgi:hypothetical protein